MKFNSIVLKLSSEKNLFKLANGVVFSLIFIIYYTNQSLLLVILFLLLQLFIALAWQKKREFNKDISNQLIDKIINRKDSIEIRKILNIYHNPLSVTDYIYKITLDTIGLDGVFYTLSDSKQINIREIKGLHKYKKELNNVNIFKKILILQKKSYNVYTKESDLETTWPEIQKNYSCYALFPVNYQNYFLGVILLFSPIPDYFSNESVLEIKKVINKTAYTLGNLQIDPQEYLGNDYKNIDYSCKVVWETNQKQLATIIATLIGRMYCAEKCFIALFDEKGQNLKIRGSFGLFKFPSEANLDLGRNVIHQVVVHGNLINVKVNDLDFTKKVLGEKFSNLLCVPIYINDKIQGVICIINKHLDLTFELVDFTVEDEQILSSLAAHIGISLSNREMYETLKTAFPATIKALINTLEARDPYTKGHSEQVARYAVMIGRELQLPEKLLESLYFAGILHDIGKLGIPENILNKPAKLTLEEFSKMKLHTFFGRQILLPISFFENLLPAIYHHHERWDGSGYPDGLKEEEIPLEARILAVADTFDAIISDRIYRPGREKEMAMNELIKGTGKQFDPALVDAFLTAMDKKEFNMEELFHWKLDTIRYIYRDVIAAVTNEQLILANQAEMQKVLKKGKIEIELNVSEKMDSPVIRKKVNEYFEAIKLEENLKKSLLLCLTEMVGNILKHAEDGVIQVVVGEEKIWLVAKDNGTGIKLRDIPKATLMKGYSTKKSLGMGFSILLEFSQRLYLETTEQGTTVVLEQKLKTET